MDYFQGCIDDRTSYQIMIACKMAKQTIKCENSYIIQKALMLVGKTICKVWNQKILVLNLKDGFEPSAEIC